MISKYLVTSFGFWKKKQRHSIPRGKTTSPGAASTPQLPLIEKDGGVPPRRPLPNNKKIKTMI